MNSAMTTDVTPSTAADLPLVHTLISHARYVHGVFAEEDLAEQCVTGQLLLGRHSPGELWGVALLQHEPRLWSLPAGAVARSYVRAVALRRLPPPYEAVPRLLAPLRTGHELRRLIAYGGESWYNAGLQASDCSETERVHFFECRELRHYELPALRDAEGVSIRPVTAADIPALTRLDALVFSELWHCSEETLVQMLMTSRMQVAECAGVLVGYNCIRLFARREAQLARMAVAPAWQGRGLGRALLVDALNAAVLGGSRTVSLNTQADNHRARQLYARYGFHFTGQQMTVFTRLDGGV